MQNNTTSHSKLTKRALVAPLLTLAMLAAYIVPASAQGAPAGETNEDQKIVAPNPNLSDQFGFAVDVDGDTMVIGARFANGNGIDQGTAYVFIQAGDSWVLQAQLRAPDAADFDLYGQSVGIDDDTIVVGSPLDNDPVPNQGSAYVFTRTGTTWTQQAKLTATDATAQSLLGQSIAIEGDTIVAGAPGQNGLFGGAAYVFARTGTTWTQQAELTPAANVGVGQSVAIDGDTIVAGAPLGGINGVLTGSAYVFARTGTTWTEQANLVASDPTVGAELGFSVAIDGETLVAGARLDDAGSAYVFTRTGLTWNEEAKLLADDGVTGDQFGFSVDIDGDSIVSGADLADGVENEEGAAYVFARTGTTWTQQTKLVATQAEGSDRFATSIATSGDIVVSGAPLEDDGAQSSTADRGSAYVLTIDVVELLGAPVTFYEDVDGDTFGDPNSLMIDVTTEINGEVVTPNPPNGFVANRADCDDTDDSVFPGADEIIGDGVDQSCDGVDEVECNGLAVTVNIANGDVPTDGDDVILGTDGPDVIDAGDGNDVICGEAGADTINGGAGADTIFGGAGADTIQGGKGNDTVTGNGGDDVIVGNNGRDTLNGNAGDDELRGNKGDDSLSGGSGEDLLVGGVGTDSLGGGKGPDTVNGSKGRDLLAGGNGADVLNGGTGTDEYNGGRGTDSCAPDPDGRSEVVRNCES